MGVVQAVEAETAESADASGRSGRRLALEVHAKVRAMILSGELAPGAPVLQAALARSLNVSRTPMREAFRLLQEEGLIENKPDQRAVVREIAPEEIDAVYTSRVVLESVGVSLTVRTAGPELVGRLEVALARMRECAAAEDDESWQRAHREFHQITTEAAGSLHVSMGGLAERSERFLRIAQLGNPNRWVRWDADHALLVDAFRDRDHDLAVRTISQHLARTAFTAMADIAPQHDASCTRAALNLLLPSS